MSTDRRRLCCELGQGGEGVVELFVDTFSGERVARKTFTARPDSRVFLYNAKRNITFLKNNPIAGLPKVNSVDVTGDELFMEYEYVPGKDLEQIVSLSAHFIEIDEPSQAPIRASDLVWIACDLFAIITSLHSAGFTHGDIKPENIVYNENTKKLTLIDIAGMSTEESPGLVVSTEAYIPPERLRDAFSENIEMSKAGDIYSAARSMLDCYSTLILSGKSEKSDFSLLSDKMTNRRFLRVLESCVCESWRDRPRAASVNAVLLGVRNMC